MSQPLLSRRPPSTSLHLRRQRVESLGVRESTALSDNGPLRLEATAGVGEQAGEIRSPCASTAFGTTTTTAGAYSLGSTLWREALAAPLSRAMRRCTKQAYLHRRAGPAPWR